MPDAGRCFTVPGGDGSCCCCVAMGLEPIATQQLKQACNDYVTFKYYKSRLSKC